MRPAVPVMRRVEERVESIRYIDHTGAEGPRGRVGQATGDCRQMDDLVINRRLTIPARFLRMETSTASGPGGQRLNRVQTRVTLRLNLERAQEVLGTYRRNTIEGRLGHRIASDGCLQVVCGRHRHQGRNLAEARDRLANLLAESLKPVLVRKPTKPTKASKTRRLDAKQRRGRRKQERSGRWN